MSNDHSVLFTDDCVELKKETREDLGIVVGTDAKGGVCSCMQEKRTMPLIRQ